MAGLSNVWPRTKRADLEFGSDPEYGHCNSVCSGIFDAVFKNTSNMRKIQEAYHSAQNIQVGHSFFVN